jgi:site-specific recombinase XerD
MQNRLISRNCLGHSYNALNRKLALRLQRWLVVQHFSEGTKRNYMRTVQFYIQFLGKKALMSATHVDVRLFITRLSGQGATLSRTHFHLQVLRKFYDFLNLGALLAMSPRD